MNKLIEKLAKQAQKVVGHTDGGYTEIKVLDQEKFAELIVRECADICMEMAAKCAGLPGDGALAKDWADWIKNDFGVEE